MLSFRSSLASHPTQYLTSLRRHRSCVPCPCLCSLVPSYHSSRGSFYHHGPPGSYSTRTQDVTPQAFAPVVSLAVGLTPHFVQVAIRTFWTTLPQAVPLSYHTRIQVSANWGLWAKTSLLPILVNKILPEHSPIHLVTSYLWPL